MQVPQTGTFVKRVRALTLLLLLRRRLVYNMQITARPGVELMNATSILLWRRSHWSGTDAHPSDERLFERFGSHLFRRTYCIRRACIDIHPDDHVPLNEWLPSASVSVALASFH